MTSGLGAPPLEPPPPPAEAARAIRQAAQATASAWMQPMNPAEHNRALSQLHSILRDLGIATRNLTRCCPSLKIPTKAALVTHMWGCCKAPQPW
jgi:hypothetical protein